MKGRLKQELHKQLLKTEGFELAEDKLILPAVAPRFFAHAGLPAVTDSLAYEPVQRILAVATSDGRIKLVGQDGIECTASSVSQVGTRYLQFLPKKGALLRVTQEGDLQLWASTDGSLLESVPFVDPVTAVAVMHDEPYVLLGCASGNVQVVSLLDRSGCLATGAATAHSMELQPYQVDVEETKGQGVVTGLTARSHAGRHRMLILHEDTGVTIWDLRYESPVVLVRNETAVALAGLSNVKATCACWIGGQGICFAVGYSSSDICIWGLPKPVQQGAPLSQPLEAVLLGKLRVMPEGEPAEAIKQLTYIPGGATGCAHNLLVLGGGIAEMPPALTILPLECLSDRDHVRQEPQPHSIPWFGSVQGWALVPPEASINEYDDPAAIMVLTEGGQLMVHDLATFQPVPLSLPFQELQAVAHCCLATSAAQVATGHVGAGHVTGPGQLQLADKLHSVTLQRLRALQGQSLGIASVAGTASKWRWVFSGGGRPHSVTPTPGTSDLYFTGHEDGRVRVWDVTGHVPSLLMTVPFDSGGPGVRLRAVTSLQVETAAGLLVVGHKQGEARVYQFSQEQQEVNCVELTGQQQPGQQHPRQQPAGFQCILQCSHHSASITAIAVAARQKLIALADEAGFVSLLDLTKPSISFAQQVAEQGLASLQVAQQVLPIPADGKASSRKSPSKMTLADGPLQTRLALFMCQADGSVASIEVEGSALVSKPLWVQPKNKSQAVSMVLLAADGSPLYPQPAHLHLSWPQNNMVSAPQHAEAFSGASAREGSGVAIPIGQPISPGSQQEGYEGEQPGSASTRHLDDTFSNKSATGGHFSPSSIDSQSESEDDDYLAAAVAAADAKQAKPKKVKHPHLRALRSKLGSISRSKDKDGSGSTHTASPHSQQGLSSRQEGFQAGSPVSLPDTHATAFSQPATASPPTPGTEAFQETMPNLNCHPHAGPLAPAPPPEAHSQDPPLGPSPTVRRYAVEPEEQEQTEKQGEVAHVVLCCEDSIRLYPAEGIRTGDRSSVKKQPLHEPIGFAAAFNGQHGPGLLDIKRAGDVGVWTLPGLEPVKVFSLSSCLGFPWSWQPEPSLLNNLHRMCALAPDGRLALVGPCNEVVTLGVLKGLQPPPPLQGLYDHDLSEASLAAARAIADLQERREPWNGILPNESAQSETTELGTADPAIHAPKAQPAGRAAGFGAFFHQVKDVASKAVEEGGAGISKMALGKRMPFGHGATPLARPAPSTLHQLFAKSAPQAESSGEVADISDEEEGDPSFQNRPSGSPIKQGWEQRQQNSSSPQNAFSSLSGAVGSMFGAQGAAANTTDSTPHTFNNSREELLHGARQPEVRGKGGVRSAAEIRSAYGRSSTRERDVRSTMADNVVALEDRGAKLRNLQDKTDDLSDGAADFASIARQLKEQQANRKWWQL